MDVAKYGGCGTRLGAHIATSSLTCLLQHCLVGSPSVDIFFKVGCLMYLKATTSSHQFLSLSKTLVIRAKHHGDAPHGCLQHIVYAHTKASTHIRHLAIAIGRRKQTETVYDQPSGIGSLGRGGLRVAHRLALHLGEYLLQMILANHMGRNDDLPLGMLVEIGDKHIFIGLPTAACHKYGRGI